MQLTLNFWHWGTCGDPEMQGSEPTQTPFDGKCDRRLCASMRFIYFGTSTVVQFRPSFPSPHSYIARPGLFVRSIIAATSSCPACGVLRIVEQYLDKGRQDQTQRIYNK